MDVDWREHQRWVRVDGRWANVVEIGEGPVVLFVHGLGGTWQNWLENIPEFAQEHRVIAVDLPGFGESPMPGWKITISRYGEWVDALLRELDIEKAVIVGNSMGGFIGAEVAMKFPDCVDRLVLVSAAGLSIEHQRNDGIQRTLEVTENLAQYGFAWGLSRVDALVRRPRGRKLLMGFVAAHPDRLAPDLVLEQVKAAGKPGFVPALDALTSYPIRDRLGDIACPTLIVWGPKDMLVPIKDAHEFERLIADSKLVIYEETGHVAMLEQPERFNADLREFVTAAPADPAPAEPVARG